MNVSRLVALVFMLAVTLFANAQKASPGFKHLTTREGLSQNSVFAILKDSKGFMWFATDDGLNKYDGYSFTVYKHDPENPLSIINNSTNGLIEDDNSNLWIVSAGGLDKFERSTARFIHFSQPNTGVVLRNIFKDSRKRIWVGTTDGFCLFDAATKNFKFYKHNIKDSNSLSQNYVYRIVEDDKGMLWIATRNGLNRFDPATEKFTHYYNEPGNNKSIGSGYVKTVYKDHRGNIWAGTQGSGVALYNPADNSFINYRHDPLNKQSLSYNDILSFAEDAAGKLWIGTENGGISVFDPLTKNFTCYCYNDIDPNSLSSNSVYSLYKDNIDNMWIGTWSGGVNFLPMFGDKFAHYHKIPFEKNSLSSNLVLSIQGDSSGYIWIGTDGGGLNRFDPGTHSFINFTNEGNDKKGIYNNYVLSVAAYTKGVLALGFHRGGFDLFDTRTNQFVHYAPSDSNSVRLTSLSVNITYKDRRGNLWIGTNDNGGLYLFNGKDKNFTRFAPNLKDNNSISGGVVYSLYESKSGDLWVGGDAGLDLFDRDSKTFKHYRYDPANKLGISNDFVYSIEEDELGNLWLGTAGGLNYFNRKTNIFTAFTEKDGLANNLICGTLRDKHGNVWISSNKGISRFDPLAKSFRNFDVSDGLQSNTFKPKACFQSADGEMFFGGVNGFNSFFPDSIRENNYVPPVYLTSFELFNKPVSIGGNSPLKQSINEVKQITLNHAQNVFTFEFAALNFTQPAQNKYSYMLEGFDDDWSDPDSKRTATYTNLNPGTYTFKVKGSNNDGVWNENGASVQIIILPPFWLTWWFLLAMVLLVCGSVVAVYRYRVNSIKKQKLLLEKKVHQQTIELVHLNKEERKARLDAEQARSESEQARQEADLANKELQLKNKELEQFAYVASHDLQEPLRTTSSFVSLLEQKYRGRLDEKADKYLSYITDASTRMRVLIRDLLDFSRLGTKGELQKVDCNKVMRHVMDDLEVAMQEAKADVQCEVLPVINGYPTEIKLLFQNLLINAIKFRKKDIAPEITISVQKLESHWQFAFKDNGIGIDKQYSERIFDIFQRLHTRSEYDGSGIGLSHCKKIVSLHRGEIWVDSIPGLGSIFYFTIFDFGFIEIIVNFSYA